MVTDNQEIDPRVRLSALLTREASILDIYAGINDVLSIEDRKQAVKDLFVMAFQTRDIRGGKGERQVAYTMFSLLLLNRKYSSLTVSLLELIPEYGCWRDLFIIAENYAREDIHTLVINQFKKDLITMKDGKVSLLAKHAPRENKYPTQFKELANRIFHDEPKLSRRLRALRKAFAEMNKISGTVEVKMCAKEFAEIHPEEIPGGSLKKYTKAFLNQPSTTKSKKHVRPSNDPDRIVCADNFTEYFGKKTKEENTTSRESQADYQTLRAQLDDERYDPIRKRLDEWYKKYSI